MRKTGFVMSALVGFGLFLAATEASAGIQFSPFVSIQSTKKIQPDKANSSQENVTNSQRQTYGVRASISMWRLLKLEGSVGQSKLINTVRTQDAVDDFGEIDYQSDADISTDDPDAELKTTETMRQARAGIVLDPGFWIFILRGKGGVQATQRLLEVEQNGTKVKDIEPPITYKPYAGAGAGIKLGRMLTFMMEYSFFFYKYPELEPFMREVSVAFTVQI